MSEQLPPVYVATINTPGYLPMDDEPPAFDTAHEAWVYLAAEREREEDGADENGLSPYSETADLLAQQAEVTKLITVSDYGHGTIYGGTPGYDGDHDLGQAYTVRRVVHRDHPHYPGYLIGCEACEAKCWCDNDPNVSECVYGGDHG